MRRSAKKKRITVFAPNPVYILNKDSTASRSIFVIPGIGGNVLPYKKMSKALSSDYKVRGIFLPAWVNEKREFKSIESYAKYFLDHMRQDQEGRVCILGYSIGGVIAFEVARQLQASGQKVCLVLFDTECPALEINYETYHGRLRHLGKRCEYALRRVKYRINGDQRSCANVNLKICLRKFTPEFLDLPVVLMRPENISEGASQRFVADMGWGNVVKDLRILQTGGQHGNAYKEKNADVFAKVLKDALNWLEHQNDTQAYGARPEPMK